MRLTLTADSFSIRGLNEPAGWFRSWQYPMLDFLDSRATPAHAARQPYVVALLLALVLCVSQLAVLGHSHAQGLAHYDDCSLCQQHNAGFDAVPSDPPQALAAGAAVATIDQGHAKAQGRPLAPRSRSPPLSFLYI